MAQAQFLFFRSKLPLHIFLSLSLSLSKDHGEGDEGDEGHEEERDREGEAREDGCVPWHEDQDRERAEEERFDEEQEREDREPQQSANGKKAYARIKGWTVAVTKARKFLGVKGFVAVKKGSPLYKKGRSSTASEHLVCVVPGGMMMALL